jgi:predicted nuclease with TOPRIM domain
LEQELAKNQTNVIHRLKKCTDLEVEMKTSHEHIAAITTENAQLQEENEVKERKVKKINCWPLEIKLVSVVVNLTK